MTVQRSIGVTNFINRYLTAILKRKISFFNFYSKNDVLLSQVNKLLCSVLKSTN